MLQKRNQHWHAIRDVRDVSHIVEEAAGVEEEVVVEEEISGSMMKVKSVVVVECYPKTLSHLSCT
jgi:broad-specificity NMP kinase